MLRMVVSLRPCVDFNGGCTDGVSDFLSLSLLIPHTSCRRACILLGPSCSSSDRSHPLPDSLSHLTSRHQPPHPFFPSHAGVES